MYSTACVFLHFTLIVLSLKTISDSRIPHYLKQPFQSERSKFYLLIKFPPARASQASKFSETLLAALGKAITTLSHADDALQIQVGITLERRKQNSVEMD